MKQGLSLKPYRGLRASWLSFGRAGTRTVEDAGAASREAAAAARQGHIQFLRLSFVTVILWVEAFSPHTLGKALHEAVVVTGVYAGLVIVTELLRRIRTQARAALTTIMLAVDVVFLGWMLLASGGTMSPLRFVLYIHLIAVTLIYSYRTGVLITLLHSITFYVVYRAQLTGFLGVQGGLPTTGQVGEMGMTLYESWLFTTLSFWLVALATAPFSSLNERELRKRKGDLEVLADMANELENLQDPNAIAQYVLDRICDAFNFGRGVVLAVRNDELTLMSRRGTDKTASASPRLDTIVDKAWETQNPVLVNRLEEETDPMISKLLPYGRNLLIAPMYADGQPLGVLVVEQADREHPVIQRRVISLVMQFAAHGALAMRNAWLLQQVQRLANTDALTGVANRRSFEKAMTRDVSRSTRSGEEVTLVLLDLDHFKSLNDQFGHQAGDEVLRRVGAVLREACRETDTPARYGGEEFAVLLPGCTKEESLMAAERLRELIAAIEAPVPITTSAGVATYPTHGRSAEDVVEAADEALYESKRAGRDRTTASSRRLLHSVDFPDAV